MKFHMSGVVETQRTGLPANPGPVRVFDPAPDRAIAKQKGETGTFAVPPYLYLAAPLSWIRR